MTNAGTNGVTNEAMRFERLRAQDGKPLMPPPNILPLCKGGGLNPALADEATRQWQAALSEMSTMPSYPAEERLFWTAFLLARHYAEAQQRPRLPQLLQQTLPALQQPRHQQLLLGLLARNAAAMGEMNTAMQTVARLDPASEDLQIDTNYRFSTAYVALISGDAQKALSVLGTNIDDIPINDAYDMVCAVYRAHAHEMMGNFELAQQQLQQIAATPRQIADIESICRVTPQIPLLQRTLPTVKQTVTQMHQDAVVTNSGINVGRLVLVPIVGSLIAVAASSGAAELLPAPLNTIGPGVIITVLVIGIIALTFAQILKGPRLRKKLMRTGVDGVAKLMVVEQTGTRVNDQPMLKLRMLVTLPGKPPYAAVHHEVVPQIRLAQVQPGVMMQVKVDPNDRKQMAIAWQ